MTFPHRTKLTASTENIFCRVHVLIEDNALKDALPCEVTAIWIHDKHDDAMTLGRFLHYWPYVKGIHQSPVDIPHKGPVIRSFDVCFVVRINKLLNKQLSFQ